MMDYPEFEGNSSIEDIVSDVDANELEQEQEQENGCLDMTYINEDDQPTNYDGVEDNNDHNQAGPYDDYTSTAALKRNLSTTFEKHVTAAEEPKEKKRSTRMFDTDSSNNINKASLSSTSTNGVKARIKAFEEKKILIKPKSMKSSKSNNEHKPRFDLNKNSRPPTAPIHQK